MWPAVRPKRQEAARSTPLPAALPGPAESGNCAKQDVHKPGISMDQARSIDKISSGAVLEKGLWIRSRLGIGKEFSARECEIWLARSTVWQGRARPREHGVHVMG